VGAGRSATRSATTPQSDGSLAPQYVIERLGAIAGPEAIYVAGVGQHQMWAAQFIRLRAPNTWINSGGLGTMGYSVPAAMGAKVGRPTPRCGPSTATAASR
jgi:acetolactate synthase-1/2/3 large subunit